MKRKKNQKSPHHPVSAHRRTVIRGTIITGCYSLMSRVLGMLRDSMTAAMLGMSAGGVMDAFVFAFRLPDVARRMFGEGSFSISFIPVFAKLRNTAPTRAWQLVSVVLFWVFLLLTAFVLLGEIVSGIALLYFDQTSKVYLAAHLISLLLPYLILISMTAIAAATLQTIGHFSIAAAVPIILNVVWLFGIVVLAPLLTDDPAGRCYLLAACVLVAGVLQFAIQIPALYYCGWRFNLNFSEVTKEVKTVGKNAIPTMLGLMTTQLNLLVSSMVAWLLAGPEGTAIQWLGGIEHPLHTGAVSAIYFSERLFEFPQGLIGMALATAIYPLLNTHAVRKNFKAFADDFSLAIRLQFVLGIPAGAGLMLISYRITHLLYQRGVFTHADTTRTADMVFWFGTGVWAFCMIPVLVRAFYAIGDIRTPLRVSMSCCLLHFFLCLTLIIPFREVGIAMATSISAILQAATLMAVSAYSYKLLRLEPLTICAARAIAATTVMILSSGLMMKIIPGNDSMADLIHIVSAASVGVIVYGMTYKVLGGNEMSTIMKKK
ncbi:MAG: murein biosynthesis integral membrane protein MurJ [Planctomycetaceae bacterium]|nr:murein biosynthesis integral membrane protein MurJ [Planctomycetaceae bacterium]